MSRPIDSDRCGWSATIEVADDADVLVILTEWPEFADLDLAI